MTEAYESEESCDESARVWVCGAPMVEHDGWRSIHWGDVETAVVTVDSDWCTSNMIMLGY